MKGRGNVDKTTRWKKKESSNNKAVFNFPYNRRWRSEQPNDSNEDEIKYKDRREILKK